VDVEAAHEAGVEHAIGNQQLRGRHVGDAVCGDLTEVGEGAFGCYGVEGLRFDGGGLDQDGSSEGFAERIDFAAAGVAEPLRPGERVVLLEKAVSDEAAFAHAVSSAVGEERGVALSQEHRGEAGASEARIAYAVEDENAGARGRCGLHPPGAESGVVCAFDCYRYCASGRRSNAARYVKRGLTEQRTSQHDDK
jgi:hypothetical protein